MKIKQAPGRNLLRCAALAVLLFSPSVAIAATSQTPSGTNKNEVASDKNSIQLAQRDDDRGRRREGGPGRDARRGGNEPRPGGTAGRGPGRDGTWRRVGPKDGPWRGYGGRGRRYRDGARWLFWAPWAGNYIYFSNYSACYNQCYGSCYTRGLGGPYCGGYCSDLCAW